MSTTKDSHTSASSKTKTDDGLTYLVAIEKTSTGGIGNLHNGDKNDMKFYKDIKVDTSHFRKTIVDNAKIKSCTSKLADACGLPNMTIYFSKGYETKFDESFEESFAMGLEYPITTAGPNGFRATLDLTTASAPLQSALTMSTNTLWADWIIASKVYVVCDDGQYPLSKEQVWGLVDMANSATKFLVAQSIEGQRADIQRWARQYRNKQWRPRDQPNMTGSRYLQTP